MKMRMMQWIVIALLLCSIFAYGCNSEKEEIVEGNDTDGGAISGNSSLAANSSLAEGTNESAIDRLVVNDGNNMTGSDSTNLSSDSLITEPEPESQPGNLEVTFLDVGFGDSVFVKTPHNASMLVDGGPNEAGSKVINLLREKGAGTALDVVVATHPDVEAVGGLDAAAFNLASISETYDNGHGTEENQDYLGFEQFTKAKGFFNVVKEDTGINLDESMGIQLIVPYVDGYMNNTNDNSLVMKMTYGSVSILLMGDCSLECEKKIMGHDLKADVMLVAHNGGEDATSQELLDNVKPKLAIISTEGYHEGYPSPVVLERLANNSIEILRTDYNGTVVVESDGNTFTARPSK